MQKKNWWKYALWVVVATIWTAVCFIAPDFIDNPIESLRSLCTVLGFIGACSIAALLLLYVIGANRYVTVVLLPVWALLGSALAFYRVGYHIAFTPMIIDVTLHTNPEEAMGVISWQLIAWVVLHLLICGVLIWWRWTKIDVRRSWAHILIGLLLFTGYVNVKHSLTSIVLNQRFPCNIGYHTYSYLLSFQCESEIRIVPNYEVKDMADSLTVVFVLGESTRADHLQLNGYERATTPLLAARANVVSFPHIFSEQTYTDICLPYMLSRADSAHREYQYNECSFIRILGETGFATAWLSSQDKCEVYASFISESDTMQFVNVGKSVYVYSEWLDEALLGALDSVYMPRPARTFYVLHTIGSHWYYNAHCPERLQRFQPTTTNRVVTNNSIERLINSYDNTVLYIDYFLDAVIRSVEDECALVVFQSDHGEALGEEGYYLHGHEIPCVQNPACVVWYSERYAARYPEKIAALHANKDKRYRTDYLFYSLLSAAGIEAEGETEEMNIFR